MALVTKAMMSTMTKSVTTILRGVSMSVPQMDTVGLVPREPPLKETPRDPIAIAMSLMTLLHLATNLNTLMLPLRRSMEMFQAVTITVPLRLHLENATLVHELLYLPQMRWRKNCQVDNVRLCLDFWMTLISKLQSLFLQVLTTGLLSWKLVLAKCMKTWPMKGLFVKSWRRVLRIWKKILRVFFSGLSHLHLQNSATSSTMVEEHLSLPPPTTCTSCWV